MPTYILNFDFLLNTSLQVGDIIYYVPITNPTASNTYDVGDLDDVQEYGVLVAINETISGFTLTVDSNLALPPTFSYIMFAKDKRANTSSLLGYYADVQFVNNSKKKAELFSVGSEITESSK